MAVRWWRSSEARGYLVAAAAIAAAVVARLVLAAVLGERGPFFPFVLAVLVAAWYGGLKPGLLATGLGAVLGLCLFVRSRQFSPDEIVRVAFTTPLFLVIGITASSLYGALHAARRRTAEKQRQLEHAEEQVRSVVNHVIDGIITIDAGGTVQSINPAAEQLFGYPAPEVVGQNVKCLMPEPYSAEHDKYLANFLGTGEAKVIGIGREVAGRRKDGSTFPMDLAVSEFWLGERHYFTGIVRDITERKRAEEALKESDRRKDEFLAMLAHELRNPLAPLRNAAEILRLLAPADQNLQRATDVIQRQIRHMTRLVDDLLDVSRITRGKIALQMERVDLAAVVTRAVETSRHLIEGRGHRLTVELPRQPVWVEGDATRLAQVFSNLLNNAAKYTPDGGHVGLTVDAGPAEAVVRVSDDGVGIAADLLPHVFDLFTQGDRSLARSEGGLGIGLSMVKSLVGMHGGSVAGRSDGVGRGSEFAVRLPTVPASPAQSANDGVSRDSPQAAPPRRVLVVDDNLDAADSLAMLLQVGGHDVRTAHDGPAALELTEAFRPEVILLDIGLPRMDGYEVARRLRRQGGGEKALLVAVTGYGQEEDRRRAEAAGFDAHLVKPADPTALQRLLAGFTTNR